MIQELSEEFQTNVKEVLENTINYGICPDTSGKIHLSDVGEVIVAAEQWCWIASSYIQHAIDGMADTYILEGDSVTRRDGAKFPWLPKYPAVPDPPKALFIGTSKGTFQKLLGGERVAGGGSVRVVADAKEAASVAIYLTNFGGVAFETKPTIVIIDTAAAAVAGMPVMRMPSAFYALDELRRDYCSEFVGTDSELNAATWKVRLNETLYLEYPDQSSDAAEFLFRLKPQPEVERELLAYLRHKFVTVRVNVAQALGVPTYMSGFSLRAPTPSRETLLEPTSVQPGTMRKIIEAAKEETELEVVQWMLCTAASQYYGGKLKPFVGEIRALTRMVDDRFGDGISDFTRRVRAALTN